MQNRTHPVPGRVCGSAGFTVIELMIGLVVVAVLAAVAMPSFMDSIRKGRRSEAFAALAVMQQAQERWRSNHATYSVTLSDLGLNTDITSSGYYKLSAAPPSSNADALVTGYVVTAVGQAGTSQANDAQCRKLSVLVDRGSVKYAGCGNCASFTYNTQDPCWNQ